MNITIYHKPNCATSRKVLAMIREADLEPRIVDYIANPPSRARLLDLMARLGTTPRGLLRRNGTPYEELALGDPRWSDEELVDLMLAQPILIERPIVVSRRGAVLARPPEKVFEVLPKGKRRAKKEGAEPLPIGKGD